MSPDDTEEAAPTPPALVREFTADLMAGDEVSYTLEDAHVDVPSRFDRPSPTATWRFDGTVTVRVERTGE
ncbi:hypothetical protein [Halosegnis sp.]|uniref:hypothetical protein n=1 Tax=Halosegnis sp. TaxID=2864959 RepID=UPI0035D458B3